MKKNKSALSSAKRVMMLSVMASIGKSYDDIKESCVFAMEKEKRGMSKVDGKISKSLVISFLEQIPELGIVGTETTVLNFCRKSCDLLITNTEGSDRIRGLTVVSDNINEQLKDLDEDQQDDSQLLMEKLG